ncbi:MAG: hypothetical protein AAGB29_12435 [Planctomycetota bacterium]
MTRRSARAWGVAAWGAIVVLSIGGVVGCDRQPPSATDDERRAYALDAELEDARDALHRGNVDGALSAVERARAIDPASHRPLVFRGRVLMREGRLAESRASYESAARLADQSAAEAIARSSLDAAGDEDREAALERREEAIKDAADAQLAAGTARLMSVFAEAQEEGPAAELSDDGLAAADASFGQAVETADLLGEDAGDRGRTARLHRALINALRGNRDAAITQIDMLEVGHEYDPDLAAFWRQAIRDGTLRAQLTQDEPAP